MTYTGMVLPNIYGCGVYELPGPPIDNPYCDPNTLGKGWVGIAYFVFARIAGALVLTTLLVGFVIQAFSEIYEAEDEVADEAGRLARFVRNADKAFPDIKVEGCPDGLGWFMS